MQSSDLLFTFVTCVFFMALVGWISYQKTKGSVDDKDGYFLAGRGLTGTFIAGSMLLTNLSAEQLIGLNGSAYGFNMSAMAWEVTAGVATIVMALLFLPRYLSGAFTTLPGFLKDRFDDDVRRMTVILFMLGYGLVTIPSVLYSGSLAVLKLFDVPTLLNLSKEASIIVTVLIVGSVGAVYAVFGGLKAVVVSDTINGIGLLIIGILVPTLGLMLLGDGSFLAGLTQIATTETQKLNAIGAPTDPVPFGTIFTGMILANLFYWGTNQYVIQRTLGAASLAEGQKGVLLSGYFKLLVPFMMMLPGVIAFHLYGSAGGQLPTIDLAYPQLVKDVLPVYLSGFFLAVLLGAVFSSFNSLLNSAATLFVLDVYQPLVKSKLKDEQLIKVAKVASVVIALFSFIVAPLLQYAPDGLWQIIRMFTGFYNIPVISIVLVGLFTTRVPALGAKVAIIFHVIVYGIYVVLKLKFNVDIGIHFIHLYAILFAIEVGIMWFFSIKTPRQSREYFTPSPKVDLTPWRYSWAASGTLFACIVALYVLFSPIGLVGGLDAAFWIALVLIAIANIGFCRWSVRHFDQKIA
ncbi:solute:sodium symporter family transporter [Arenicella sp. 4NH20-0111]|uniref:solute:sodium symporter family transporter n=1 Tax=Arenicella sp. 4NH20-0111 TaxID=3127648 RepID=UPI003105112E